MGITDDLQKLDELHRGGTLTDEEFTKAKHQLLSPPPATLIAAPLSFSEEQLAEVRYQNELARIDREWEIERRRYELVGRRGHPFIPTLGAGIATIVMGSLFGGLWTVVTWLITPPIVNMGFDSLGIITALRWLPVIGILWIIYAMTKGLYYVMVAQNHNWAFRTYQSRRANAIKA